MKNEKKNRIKFIPGPDKKGNLKNPLFTVSFVAHYAENDFDFCFQYFVLSNIVDLTTSSRFDHTNCTLIIIIVPIHHHVG